MSALRLVVNRDKRFLGQLYVVEGEEVYFATICHAYPAE